MARRRRVTMAEVAREAGVSKTTVSVILNGASESVGIRPATRANVLETMARLGYMPNHVACSLRSRQMNVLTLLVQDLANPCFTDIAVAARAAAEAKGYTLNVVGAGPADAVSFERLIGEQLPADRHGMPRRHRDTALQIAREEHRARHTEPTTTVPREQR